MVNKDVHKILSAHGRKFNKLELTHSNSIKSVINGFCHLFASPDCQVATTYQQIATAPHCVTNEQAAASINVTSISTQIARRAAPGFRRLYCGRHVADVMMNAITTTTSHSLATVRYFSNKICALNTLGRNSSRPTRLYVRPSSEDK